MDDDLYGMPLIFLLFVAAVLSQVFIIGNAAQASQHCTKQLGQLVNRVGGPSLLNIRGGSFSRGEQNITLGCLTVNRVMFMSNTLLYC